jgi:hypothetical protein
MGVGYLSRVAGRGLPAAGSAVRQPGVPARPAVASRSPVAEADQRLHLDDFAAAFISVPAEPAGDAAQDLDASLPDAPAAGRAFEAPGVAQSQTPASQRQLAAARQSGLAMSDKSIASSDPVTASSKRQEASDGRSPGTANPSVARPTAGMSVDSYPDGIESNASSNKSANANIEAIDALAASPTVPQTRPIGTASTARPASVSQSSSESAIATVTAVPSNALSKQLATLERWLEGAPEPQTSPADAPRSAEAQPVTESRATAQSARPAHAPPATSSASIDQPSRLEIGSIEVEVIAPPKVPVAPQRQLPIRPGRSTERHSLARPFGWRQR